MGSKHARLAPGTRLGSYLVEELVGEGGMGAVYLGAHELLGSRAAIKVLHPKGSRNPEMLDRFFAEARASSEIAHPGIVQVFDFGYRPDGAAFMVMEYLAGETLAERLERRGRLPSHEIRRLGRQIASALGAAHDRGIIHRDLKPENILVVPDPDVAGGERVKVLDFGVAKLRDFSGARTRTGEVFGTPLYMSPEQCHGDRSIDHRSDVYSLGCVLFELSSGQPPFLRDSAVELLAAHAYDAPPAVSEAGGDPALDELVARAMAKEPGERLSSMAALARGLEQTAPRGRGARRRWAATAATIAVALIGAGLAAGSSALLGAEPAPVAEPPPERAPAPTVDPLEPTPAPSPGSADRAEPEAAAPSPARSREPRTVHRPRRAHRPRRDRAAIERRAPQSESTYDPRGYR